MAILKQFSVRIKELRSSKGITQEDLAALSGLSRQYIGDVERGKRNISILNIEKIAKAFGITISELINFNE
jgi:transcriptional regulator with XRE-family HTH domain